MDALQAILTRRSIRRYTSEPVCEGDVESLLCAAMSAPSSGNGRPWHFVVINRREVLDQIAAFHPSAEVLQGAPLAILVCGNELEEKNPGRWSLDCAAAAENLLLAAHALGLGAVWLAVWPEPIRTQKLVALMELPEGVHPLALIAIGHPAETPLQVDRFNPEHIHNNHW